MTTMTQTPSGIVCNKCSHWTNGKRVQVRHATIEQIRRCDGPTITLPAVAPVPTQPRFLPAVADWAEVRRLQNQLPNFKVMHYAIEVLDFEVGPEPVWKFYRVDKPNRGRYAGKTFLSVQASDDFHPVRNPERIANVLKAILANVEKAVSNYGHQIGRCGICHRTLTDAESIARGIGPVCANKAGW